MSKKADKRSRVRKAAPRVVFDTDTLLLDGLNAASPGLVEEARAIAALIDEAERLGALHTKAEEAGAPREQEAEAEEVWQEAWDGAAEAGLALLIDDATGGDAAARLTVYLRQRALYCTPRRQWRPLSAQEAIERLQTAMPGSDADLAPALAFAMKLMPPADCDRETLLQRYEWQRAREAFNLALAALQAPHDEDDDGNDPVFVAAAAALEHWESLPPPDLSGMIEVMGASLAFNGLHWGFQDVDCPRAMRDLLDSSDTYEIFTARYYLHALRLIGSQSQALTTPPIAGLFPSFRSAPIVSSDVSAEEFEKAWDEHHRMSDPYEERLADFATWRLPVLDEYRGEGVQQVSRYQFAVFTYAEQIVADYEARGGRFHLVLGDDGERWFGTGFARDGSEEAARIEELVAGHDNLRRAIASIVERRAQVTRLQE